MVFVSLVLLMFIFNYFLVVLIVMELVISNLSLFMFWTFSSGGMGGVFVYYLVFSVCESVMGLGILVLLIRYYGGDYYQVVSSGKF